MTLCKICCDNYNEIGRKCIYCPYCNEDCCMRCLMKYFLEEKEPAHCIYKCSNRSWNIKFLSDNFPRTYIWGNNKLSYKNHREKILLEQQMSLMHDTQQIIEKENKIEILIKKKNEIKNIINIYEHKLNICYKNPKSSLTEECNIKTIINNYYKEYNDICKNINKIKNNTIDKDKNPINRGNCPECPGFISEGWKCGMCNIKVCNKCREKIEYNDINKHICKEEILATMEKLKQNNYRSCPKCKVYIEKINGCNQMWCTNCKIFFDWATNKIIQKTIFVHNPHYQEWLEQGNVDIKERIGDCDVNIYTIINLKDITDKSKKKLCNMVRFINEIREQVINDGDTESKLDESLLDIRKKYLKGIYDKKKLSIHTQRLYKKESKSNETNQIRDMFSDTCVQLIGKLIINVKQREKEYKFSKVINNNFQISYIEYKISELYDDFIIEDKYNEEKSKKYIENLIILLKFGKNTDRIFNYFNDSLVYIEKLKFNWIEEYINILKITYQERIEQSTKFKKINEEEINSLFEQIYNIYIYTLDNLNEVGHRYNSTIPLINKNIESTTNIKLLFKI